jgi:hypothetical protein
MPIEIRELVIKTRVEDSTPLNPALPGAAPSSNGNGPALNASQLENIIAQVLERVMDALKQQNER